MRKLKLYIETSTWNFYYAHDAPTERDITREFFEVISKGVYEGCISDVVVAETEKAPEVIRKKLLDLVKEYKPVELAKTEQAERLARLYLKRNIIPAKKEEDAF